MADEFLQLSPVQKDILKEVSNIGAGSGATALAHLLRRKITMTVPGVRVLPLEEVATVTGGADHKVVGIFQRVEGPAPCSIIFFLSIDSAMHLVDMLLNRALGTTRFIDKLNMSALEEMGNIVSGSFLNALGGFTGLKFVPSVPSVAIDMAGAMLNSVLYHYGQVGDHALIIDTEFAEQDRHLAGNFFLFPDPGSLTKILSALGVSNHGACC